MHEGVWVLTITCQVFSLNLTGGGGGGGGVSNKHCLLTFFIQFESKRNCLVGCFVWTGSARKCIVVNSRYV